MCFVFDLDCQLGRQASQFCPSGYRKKRRREKSGGGAAHEKNTEIEEMRARGIKGGEKEEAQKP